MKFTLSLFLTLATLTPAYAQLFRPEAVNGAVLGGIAGAVIGNNSGDLRHNAWKGAAIGAGAGLILGEAIGNANAARADTQVRAVRGGYDGDYVYRRAPSVQVGVGYGWEHGYRHGARHHSRWHDYPHRHRYGYFGYDYAPAYRYYPRYGYSYYPGYSVEYPYYSTGHYGTGNAAGTGLLLGALAGGIIGHNSGDFRHNGWRGAAWGAGAGWLLGSVIDAHRRPVVYETAPVVAQPATTVAPQAAPTPAQPQQVTIINNYYHTASPMSGANGLFGR